MVLKTGRSKPKKKKEATNFFISPLKRFLPLNVLGDIHFAKAKITQSSQ